MLIERRTATTLVQLRHELDGLRSGWEHERAARAAAQQRADELAGEAAERRQRSQQALDAIVELRGVLRDMQASAAQAPPSATAQAPPSATAQEPPPPGDVPPPRDSAPAATRPVEPERFNVARIRLREAVAPPDPDSAPGPAAARAAAGAASATGPPASAPPEPTALRPWLKPIFRALVRTDADAAGRLLLELLPAQHAAAPEPVAYDLVLGGHRGCARVTVKDGAPVIRYADGPRPGGEVDFQVLGDPAALARLLTAGPLRRRWGRGVARVRGRRDRLRALRALTEVRLDFPGLYRAGVRLAPEMTLMIVARLIEPAWTARERFTLAYAGEAATVYLLVRDGHPLEVTDEAPGDRIATTITGPADALPLVLSGERGQPVTVSGEDWPLALLRKWIKRAQSD